MRFLRISVHVEWSRKAEPSSRRAGRMRQLMTEVHHHAHPRVLFVAEAVTLAHIARPIALARKLVARGYQPIIAADPRYAGLCPPEGWDTTDIRSVPTADFLRALARGKPVYDLATLERYVEDDLALLSAVRPAVVVGDFRISLAVSARLARVPYINISNAYWSPHARPSWRAPTMPWSRFLPAALDDAVFRAARPLAFRLHAGPMRALARRHGVALAGDELRHAYTEGDRTLYADSPALVPTFDLPSSHRYLGLVDWSPAVPLPAWWPSLAASPKPIYVTLGSSGDATRLPCVLDGLARLGGPIVVATAGATITTALPMNVHVAAYLPGDAVARQSRLVVCNGGSPTSHQALLHGVPVLALPSNLDQVLNSGYLCGAGVAAALRFEDSSAARVAAAARSLLDDDRMRERAATLAVRLARQRPVTVLARAIDELTATRTVEPRPLAMRPAIAV